MINTENEGIDLLLRLIARNAPHAAYTENVQDAEVWKKIVTGKDQDDLITSYKVRESEEQKQQRIRLLNSPTKRVVNQVMGNADHLDSDDGRVTVVLTPSETAQKIIDTRISKFNGDRGLMQYLLTNCKNKFMCDPNAFLVVLFDGKRDSSGAFIEKPFAKPIIIESKNVYDIGIENGDYSHLCAFSTLTGEKSGQYKQYTLYIADWVITATEINQDNPNKTLAPTVDVRIDKKSVQYLVSSYYTGSKEVPFAPFGYIQRVDGSGFLSFMESTREDFLDLINRASEYALTVALHVFMRGYQYVKKCTHAEKNLGRCDNGTMSASKTVCPSCHGSGKQIVTTTQEMVTIPIPEEGEPIIPLGDMIHYPNIPFQIVDHLKEAMTEIPIIIERALWGVYLQETPAGPQTATEIMKRYSSVYARLNKMETKIAAMWEKCVRLIGNYAEVEVTPQYQPRTNYNMETVEELVIILKSLKEAGAPYETIWATEINIMEKMPGVTDTDIAWAKAKRRFMPFKDKPADAVSEILANLSEKDYFRVLWMFFDSIFSDIRETNPAFLKMTFPGQKAIVDKAVEQYKELVDTVTMQEATRSKMTL